MSGQARRLPTLSQILTLDRLDNIQGNDGAVLNVDSDQGCSSSGNNSNGSNSSNGRQYQSQSQSSYAQRENRWANRDSEYQSAYQSAAQREQQTRSEQEWYAAIAALNQLLAQNVDAYSVAVCDGATPVKGVVLSGPAPILESPTLSEHFADWVLTSEPAQVSLQLPPNLHAQAQEPARVVSLPISQSDPIIGERFCLVLTADFCLVLTLGQSSEGQSEFQFSFNPAIVERAWQTLRIRLSLTSPHQVQQMETYIQQFAPVEPDYQLVMQFQRLMLKQLPIVAASLSARETDSATTRTATHANVSRQSGSQAQAQTNGLGQAAGQKCDRTFATVSTVTDQPDDAATAADHLNEVASSLSLDAELLRAMAHEIRTPLTTIRTLTRSLMRRTELGEKVLHRLKQIDQECTQQIDRFGLIFRAVELETQQPNHAMGSLSAIALDQVFQDSIPKWQQQAQQRNIQLDVALPHTLPWVVSDPVMLNQVLTNVIERFALSLPGGSHLQLGVTPAGHQLKLQFKTSLPKDAAEEGAASADGLPSSQPFTFASMAMDPHAAFKSIGQLLMVQPETGNLSLNLSATKNLFQALGGKLIVKQRPRQGEVMTIFLPLDLRQHKP